MCPHTTSTCAPALGAPSSPPIRQHTPAYVSIRQLLHLPLESRYLGASSIEPSHTSAYASIRQHTSAVAPALGEPLSRRELHRALPRPFHIPSSSETSVASLTMPPAALSQTPAYGSIRQHTSAYGDVCSFANDASRSSLSDACIRQHTAAYVSIRRRL
jgi:hypothetical protein